MNRKHATKDRESSAKRQSKEAKPQICNADLLRRAIGWIVDRGIFDQLPQHGNTSWLPTHLIALAILWVWSDQSCFTNAFSEARQTALTFYEQLTLASYQGFVRALVTWNEQLRALLWFRLHQLMEQVAGKYWRCGEFLVLAVDGSRVTVPRTKSNERAFAATQFPNEASLLRLATAVLIEIDEEWQSEKNVTSLKSRLTPPTKPKSFYRNIVALPKIIVRGTF